MPSVVKAFKSLTIDNTEFHKGTAQLRDAKLA